MKVTYEFDPFADSIEMEIFQAAPKMLAVLSDMDREMRNAAKYEDDAGADKWRTRMFNLCADVGIDLTELGS